MQEEQRDGDDGDGSRMPFPEKAIGFGPIPARIRGKTYVIFYCCPEARIECPGQTPDHSRGPNPAPRAQGMGLVLPDLMDSMLLNCASGQEIGLPGRISAGFLSGKLRPAEGQPESLYCGFPVQSPTEVRPGRPISGPEALVRNVGHIVTGPLRISSHPLEFMMAEFTGYARVHHYRCLRHERPSKPHEFIGFGVMDATKPKTNMGFGDIHGPKRYECMGLRWEFISQTPVVHNLKQLSNYGRALLSLPA